ncbi:hypothetical protein HAX54_042580, partial [Datura stramonium]|nr:hypothetical protein [Datura stramonium]
MTIDYSPVGSGETPLEHRFKLQLAYGGHYFDPALPWRGSWLFEDAIQWLTDVSP